MALYRFQKWVYDSTEVSNTQITVPVGTLDINLTAYYEEVVTPFNFSVSATPLSQSVEAGDSVSFNVDSALLTGATEPVALGISGLPAYAQISFSPSSGNPPFSSVLNIQTSTNTPVGSYLLTITGVGSVTRTTTVTLVVTPYITPFDFAISATPSSQAVTVGDSTNFAVAATLLAGQSENVVLAIDGLPTGATASFSPSSGNPPFASTLTVRTLPSTPTGTYVLTIAGYGSVDRSTTVTITVNPPAPFDFSIDVSPSSQPVIAGNSTTFAVSTSLVSGFAEAVNLAVLSGLPAYTNATFLPASGTTPFTSTLTIQTGDNTPIGNYNVTIAGIGSVDHTAIFNLEVQPKPIDKGTILVSASIGTAVISNGQGEITDSNGIVLASFTETPFSWTEAVVGVEYSVVCRVAGYPDQIKRVTVQTNGTSVPVTFVYTMEAGFPLWMVAVAGGTLILGYFFKGGGKGRRK